MAGWRIAIASSDGKVVNIHFGRACFFHIVDLDEDGTYEYIEKRPVLPLCSGGEHTSKALFNILHVLKDCSGVLVARVGPEVKRTLEEYCISVFEIPKEIDQALMQVSDYLGGLLPSDG